MGKARRFVKRDGIRSPVNRRVMVFEPGFAKEDMITTKVGYIERTQFSMPIEVDE